MDFNEYQKETYKAIQAHSSSKEEEMHWALGTGEEAGELLGVIKHRHYGGEFSTINLVKELGDVLWHISAMCTVFGIEFEDVAKYNIMKLNNRYPNGKFDVSRSSRRHMIDKRLMQDPDAKKLMAKINSDYLKKQEEHKKNGF